MYSVKGIDRIVQRSVSSMTAFLEGRSSPTSGKDVGERAGGEGGKNPESNLDPLLPSRRRSSWSSSTLLRVNASEPKASFS